MSESPGRNDSEREVVLRLMGPEAERLAGARRQRGWVETRLRRRIRSRGMLAAAWWQMARGQLENTCRRRRNASRQPPGKGESGYPNAGSNLSTRRSGRLHTGGKGGLIRIVASEQMAGRRSRIIGWVPPVRKESGSGAEAV